MVQLINQCAYTKAVAQKDKLVLELGALFACAREVLDRTRPLDVRRALLARERVNVVHK